MRVIKCHGSGNDFYLVDRRETAIDEPDLSRLAISLSCRSGPFGADGLLLVEAGAAGPRMRIFNADGSEAEMCGNGLRCVGRYLLDSATDDHVVIETRLESLLVRRTEELAAGVRTMAYESSAISFDVGGWLLGHHRDELTDEPLPSLGTQQPFTAVRFPNPHVIAVTDQVSLTELARLGSAANGTDSVFPVGVNVSMIRRLGPRSLYCATFERGVGLTMACGTAMSASAIVAARHGLVPTQVPIEILTWGGKVRIIVAEDLASVAVEGNATFVFTAQLPLHHALAGDPGPTLQRVPYLEETAAYERLRTELRSELRDQLAEEEYGRLDQLGSAG